MVLAYMMHALHGRRVVSDRGSLEKEFPGVNLTAGQAAEEANSSSEPAVACVKYGRKTMKGAAVFSGGSGFTLETCRAKCQSNDSCAWFAFKSAYASYGRRGMVLKSGGCATYSAAKTHDDLKSVRDVEDIDTYHCDTKAYWPEEGQDKFCTDYTKMEVKSRFECQQRCFGSCTGITFWEKHTHDHFRCGLCKSDKVRTWDFTYLPRSNTRYWYSVVFYRRPHTTTETIKAEETLWPMSGAGKKCSKYKLTKNLGPVLSVLMCQALVNANAGCSTTFQTEGKNCRCVRVGKNCPMKRSSIFNVYEKTVFSDVNP